MLIVKRLRRSEPPPRLLWAGLSRRVSDAPSVWFEADALHYMLIRLDGSMRAAGVAAGRRENRTLTAAEWRAWTSWTRRWDRFRDSYYDWRLDNREDRRRHGGVRRNKAKTKSARAARKRAKR